MAASRGWPCHVISNYLGRQFSLASLFCIVCEIFLIASSAAAVSAVITPIEVEDAQKRWAEGIIGISTLYETGGAASKEFLVRAERFVNESYGYDSNDVLFAPAEAMQKQFRTTAAGAISYFASGNDEFPEDDGFALRHWVSIRWVNEGISVFRDEAMVAGSCYLKNVSGDETKLEVSFGFFRAADQSVKINLHHSSYPYVRNNVRPLNSGITEAEIRAAQRSWGNSIIEIGKAFSAGLSYADQGAALVDQMYAYHLGDVLFKPAEAAEPQQFRRTREGAIAYFIGDNSDFSADGGFALKPWVSISHANLGLVLGDDVAFAVGKCTFTDADGAQFLTQYTIAYVKDTAAGVRIQLHHATVPQGGDLSESTVDSIGDVAALDVVRMQRVWASNFLAIRDAYTMQGDYRLRAARFVDSIYAFDIRPTFFHPAEAMETPFRLDRNGAISYFVGGDSRFSEDRGFALRPWKDVRFENAAITVQSTSGEGIAMGNMFFSDQSGVQTKVQFTLGYFRDEAGSLRVNLHHAAYPFPGKTTIRTSFIPITEAEVVQAQLLWSQGVVSIGKLVSNRTSGIARAQKFVDDLYGFGSRPVFLRVSDGSEGNFRFTSEGVLSYFVGKTTKFPGDKGLAWRNWKEVRFENSGGISVGGIRAKAMGNCIFSDASGSETLEYSVVYFRGAEGNIRIELQHLSQPYQSSTGLGIDLGFLAKGAKQMLRYFNVYNILIGVLCLAAMCGCCFVCCVSCLPSPRIGGKLPQRSAVVASRDSFGHDSSSQRQLVTAQGMYTPVVRSHGPQVEVGYGGQYIYR
eukprot:TRINITY_DN23393_c0_g1_i1.p1 TRINITY_DN23393_c0_g1~~TRINITY_DN23393_c0_g1_i1.p1  ORF type:complete len:802 (+),score=89.80 TRINITY_DN23393_c0_g1_i1:113-2518(+)